MFLDGLLHEIRFRMPVHVWVSVVRQESPVLQPDQRHRLTRPGQGARYHPHPAATVYRSICLLVDAFSD
jgi:hypothetical protein